jgi:mRNA interferase RelE/StbE
MAGEEHAYRIRIGDYRVVYDVLEDVIVVLVLRIGHRKDVYRS